VKVGSKGRRSEYFREISFLRFAKGLCGMLKQSMKGLMRTLRFHYFSYELQKFLNFELFLNLYNYSGELSAAGA
jgi:hypothetical protein